jgi:hypothetical protein
MWAVRMLSPTPAATDRPSGLPLDLLAAHERQEIVIDDRNEDHRADDANHPDQANDDDAVDAVLFDQRGEDVVAVYRRRSWLPAVLFAGWSWPLLNSSGVHYSSTDHAAPNRQPRPRLPRLCRRECWCVEISEAAVGPRFLLAASK